MSFSLLAYRGEWLQLYTCLHLFKWCYNIGMIYSLYQLQAMLLCLHLPPQMKGYQCPSQMTGKRHHLLLQRPCRGSLREELYADFNFWKKCKAKMNSWKPLLNSIKFIREALYIGQLLLLRQICHWRNFVSFCQVCIFPFAIFLLIYSLPLLRQSPTYSYQWWGFSLLF